LFYVFSGEEEGHASEEWVKKTMDQGEERWRHLERNERMKV